MTISLKKHMSRYCPAGDRGVLRAAKENLKDSCPKENGELMLYICAAHMILPAALASLAENSMHKREIGSWQVMCRKRVCSYAP